MGALLPSPAVSVIGRHDSGKTTLVEKLIARLCAWGLDVGSVKHHGHPGFQIDVPGKDSYRHRAAGASETWIASPGQIAMVKTVAGDTECAEIVRRMPGHDVVIVEGYRLSGLPAIEVMRAGNERDSLVARAFYEASLQGVPLSCDILQSVRRGPGPASRRPEDGGGADRAAAGSGAFQGCLPADDLAQKMPGSATVAIASDIPLAHRAAANYGIPSFDIDDADAIAAFVRERFARPRLTVAIQAGGESRRMGRSKATVPFSGRPLIARMVERLAPVADELLVTTNEPERLGFLREMFPHLSIRMVRDECDRRGALPGLLTALKNARTPYVAVVACDMVFASADLVAREYRLIREEGADACVPMDAQGFEPFHSLFRVETCLPECEKAVAEGEMRPRVLFDRLSVAPVDRASLVAQDPEGSCFANVNTPQELEEAERIVARRPDLR